MIYNIRRQKDDERDKTLKAALGVEVVAQQIPKSADLRPKCPPVFNQGQLGSCSANAGCANIAMILNKPSLVLSRLYMYYKEREKEGTVFEDSGAQMRDICKVAAQGVCEEKHFPYIEYAFTCPPSEAAKLDAANYKAKSYHACRTLNDIKRALAFTGVPVLMGMEVFASFESEAVAKTGVMTMPADNEENMGGHAVLIVGYNDANQCLIVRNSWGAEWGDKGYFYMPYEYITKGLAFDFWVLN